MWILLKLNVHTTVYKQILGLDVKIFPWINLKWCGIVLMWEEPCEYLI